MFGRQYDDFRTFLALKFGRRSAELRGRRISSLRYSNDPSHIPPDLYKVGRASSAHRADVGRLLRSPVGLSLSTPEFGLRNMMCTTFTMSYIKFKARSAVDARQDVGRAPSDLLIIERASPDSRLFTDGHRAISDH